MSRVSRHWPEISICLCGLIVLVAGADIDVPGRLALALVFVSIVPGLALVRLLQLDDPVAELTIAVATSLSLALLLATACAYAFGLLPRTVLFALVAITIAANVAEALRSRHRVATGEPT